MHFNYGPNGFILRHTKHLGKNDEHFFFTNKFSLCFYAILKQIFPSFLLKSPLMFAKNSNKSIVDKYCDRGSIMYY